MNLGFVFLGYFIAYFGHYLLLSMALLTRNGMPNAPIIFADWFAIMMIVLAIIAYLLDPWYLNFVKNATE